MKKIGKILVQMLHAMSWTVVIIGLIPGLLMLGFTSLFKPDPDPEEFTEEKNTVNKDLAELFNKISKSIKDK